jgi:hypothetical protein
MIDRDGNALAATAIDFQGGFAHRARQRVRARSHRPPGDIDNHPFAREGEGDSLAYPSTGTRHYGNFACQ